MPDFRGDKVVKATKFSRDMKYIFVILGSAIFKSMQYRVSRPGHIAYKNLDLFLWNWLESR